LATNDLNNNHVIIKKEPIHRLLYKYLLEKRKVAVVFLVSMMFFFAVCLLYQLENMDRLLYAFFLWAFTALCFGVYDFVMYVRHYTTLYEVCINLQSITELLPEPGGTMEEQYQQIIHSLADELRNLKNDISARDTEMTDYYTLWAHQIKVPISAMKLLIQNSQHKSGVNECVINDSCIPEDNDPAAIQPAGDALHNCSKLLTEELFKIEQYVEMVLYYQRLDSISSDFLFKKYDLHDIVKQALKKNSMLFISSRLSFDMQPFSYIVITDEKWLQFVIGQILSNAVKYTPAGGISIHAESSGDTVKLIIEDTGIGIRPEDLPRIFERGFTGYNGRLDKKSTGIGLYLCKKILDKLSHTVEVTSEYGKGTRVTIGIAKEPELFP